MMSEKVISQEKKDTVTEIVGKLNAASIVFVSDFRGLTVSQITNLRSALRKDEAEAKVYKNKLAKRAFDESGIEYDENLLKGPSLFITTTSDVAKVSKILVTYGKDQEAFKIKGGFLDKKIIDEQAIKELADLPSRDELIARVVGQIKAPITGFVTQLSSPIRGIVGVLNSIEKKKQEVL